MENIKAILPGERVVETRRFRLFNTYFPMDTYKDYLRENNGKQGKNTKQGLSSFFHKESNLPST